MNYICVYIFYLTFKYILFSKLNGNSNTYNTNIANFISFISKQNKNNQNKNES